LYEERTSSKKPGESILLLKESVQLLDSKNKLDIDDAHKNAVLFSGTKVLQASPMGVFQYANPMLLIDPFARFPSSDRNIVYCMGRE
jgi:hypothetical protein